MSNHKVKIVEAQAGRHDQTKEAADEIASLLDSGFKVEGYAGTYLGGGRGGMFSTLLVKPPENPPTK